MTTMVETVARAMYQSECPQDHPFPDVIERRWEREAGEWLFKARVAIAAMRTPTEGMLRAGVRAFQKSYNPFDTLADWRAAYQAEIDAACKESKL